MEVIQCGLKIESACGIRIRAGGHPIMGVFTARGEFWGLVQHDE